ncbi:MAG TPA: hypothetical protein VGF28_07115 [Thermoanaerobaculia bacterium]|jgi:hypothetical protein
MDLPFPRVRPRPETLSNRGCCFSDEDLEQVLRTADDHLRWRDFEAIFPVSGCAGEYDEQLYFVPLAFAHLAANAMDGREYASGFVQFFERNADLIGRDELRDPAEQAFAALLAGWTATFEVVHYDAAASAKKGWTIPYLDGVERSLAVTELLELLFERPTLEHVGETAVLRLLEAGAPETSAAWFLELARAMNEGSLYLPDNVSARAVRALLSDPLVLSGQYERIRDSLVAAEPSPTYWRDVLVAIGLTAPA